MADFWGIMEARGEGNIPNLDYLTMFADYRVPQGLVYLGALRYSDALMETLKNGLLCLYSSCPINLIWRFLFNSKPLFYLKDCNMHSIIGEFHKNIFMSHN